MGVESFFAIEQIIKGNLIYKTHFLGYRGGNVTSEVVSQGGATVGGKVPAEVVFMEV